MAFTADYKNEVFSVTVSFHRCVSEESAFHHRSRLPTLCQVSELLQLYPLQAEQRS